jgi:hypothetical protein
MLYWPDVGLPAGAWRRQSQAGRARARGRHLLLEDKTMFFQAIIREQRVYDEAKERVRHSDLEMCRLNLVASSTSEYAELIRGTGLRHHLEMLRQLQAHAAEARRALKLIAEGAAKPGDGKTDELLRDEIAQTKHFTDRLNAAITWYHSRYGQAALTHAKKLHDQRLLGA